MRGAQGSILCAEFTGQIVDLWPTRIRSSWTSRDQARRGAIIDLGRIGPDALAAAFEPKLAGLLIEGHATHKVILGTRVVSILAAVREHLRAAEAAARAKEQRG